MTFLSEELSCCIFQPANGCFAPPLPVEMLFFFCKFPLFGSFCGEKREKEKKRKREKEKKCYLVVCFQSPSGSEGA